MQQEAGRGHGGVREHGLCHGHLGVGADGARLDHADRCHHGRGHQGLAGVLVVGKVDPLAKAGARGLAGGEVVVRGQQALPKALPAAGRGSPPGSAHNTGYPELRAATSMRAGWSQFTDG